MSKHSPGPWAWTRHNTSLVDARGSEVVYNYCADPRLRTSPADERLIAAAPELLEALRGLYENLQSYEAAKKAGDLIRYLDGHQCDCCCHGALIRRIEGEE